MSLLGNKWIVWTCDNEGGSRLIQQVSTLNKLHWLWEKPRLVVFSLLWSMLIRAMTVIVLSASYICGFVFNALICIYKDMVLNWLYADIFSVNLSISVCFRFQDIFMPFTHLLFKSLNLFLGDFDLNHLELSDYDLICKSFWHMICDFDLNLKI